MIEHEYRFARECANAIAQPADSVYPVFQVGWST